MENKAPIRQTQTKTHTHTQENADTKPAFPPLDYPISTSSVTHLPKTFPLFFSMSDRQYTGRQWMFQAMACGGAWRRTDRETERDGGCTKRD
ncbi:hypothetical protein HanRHA438_Chr14g0649411 [Helianthus annuus]|uniref:Uncharacterized protein n=1 Tax=Helianthus annuus TaxID=4232 RepID=A0A251V3L3_HELAN|nr:hypothetical protein HanIR_Chr14g0693381 [Helianthus annuus]KAJ0853287.1 hypothetical protein HanRHA438_Chr14g0649411 [Helianthus annuus]